MATTPELMVNNLCVQFGGLKAVDQVCFSLKPQTLAGLIGPNGAGKTTVFNALTGLCPVTSGQISFNEKQLTNEAPHNIARYGIARTFQNIRLFRNLTVLDNLRIAYHQNRQYSLLCSVFRSARFKRKRRRYRKLRALALVDLADKADHIAGSLPRRTAAGGNRSGIDAEPQLLLLDEQQRE